MEISASQAVTREAAALVLAGLIAEGETEIHRVYHIDRGMSGSRRGWGDWGR